MDMSELLGWIQNTTLQSISHDFGLPTPDPTILAKPRSSGSSPGMAPAEMSMRRPAQWEQSVHFRRYVYMYIYI